MSPANTGTPNEGEGMQSFNALRAWWSQSVREEGPLDGWPEWMALRERADYPGDSELLPVVKAAIARCRWQRNDAPILAQFLENGAWRATALADPLPPADPTTTTAPVSVRGVS